MPGGFRAKGAFLVVGKRSNGYNFPLETYSTIEVENIWKAQRHGDLYFAHGSEHRRGVMVLIKASFDFKFIQDSQVHYFILRADEQEQIFTLIYAPNKTNEQCIFFPKNLEGDCNKIPLNEM